MRTLNIRGKIIAIMILLFVNATANASFVYSYTGNNYTNFSGISGGVYDASMFVSGTFELGTALAPNLSSYSINPLTFSFNDGINTVTQANTNSATFLISTDGTGGITGWNIDLNSVPATDVNEIKVYIGTDSTYIDTATLSTCTAASGGHCSSYTLTDAVSNAGNPGGTWEVTSVPVPAAGWLFGSGLLGLIGMARRNKAA
jgi:hypothetical protein